MSVGRINNTSATGAQYLQNSVEKAQDSDFESKFKVALATKDAKKLKEASKGLETLFVNNMFSEMRKTVGKSDLTESAPGKDIFESMFYEKVAESSSKGKGFGLADMIYKQLSKQIGDGNTKL